MPNFTTPYGSRYCGIFRDMVNGTTEIWDDSVLAATYASGTGTLVGAVLPQALTIGGIAYTFPADNGDAGEQLQTDGAGVLTWEASGV